MISKFDTYILPESACNRIINLYSDKVSNISVKNLRSQKNYHEIESNSWLHSIVSELINKNLGDEYQLLERVTILRYDSGDYFTEHIDGTHNYGLNNNIPYHFYGGVELSNKSEFKGGEFFIEGTDVEYKKGRLFTHGFYDKHGVRMVDSGTRWSIHFLIKKNEKISNLI